MKIMLQMGLLCRGSATNTLYNAGVDEFADYCDLQSLLLPPAEAAPKSILTQPKEAF